MCVCVGLRDWYLRNTIGSSHQSQVDGKVKTGVDGGVKGQTGRGGALQTRRKTIGGVQPPTYHADSTHQASPHRKQMLPHSATFHGHLLHGRSGISSGRPLSGPSTRLTWCLHHRRSVDGALHRDAFAGLKQEGPTLDQASPGTLV